MHDALRASLGYATRSSAFLLLLTEVHPRLLELPPQEMPAGSPSLPSPQQLPEGTAQIAQPPPPPPPGSVA
jgi:hypothetical protein